MIKIPINNKFTVPNNSDKFGSIWYTKNINLDEEGYAKLSSRVVSIYDSETADDANADLGLPLAFGRAFAGSSLVYNVITATGDGFTVEIGDEEISIEEDTGTGNPGFTSDSHGAFYRNLWTVSDDNDFFTKADATSTATYTDRGNLTSGKAHPIEVFRNRDTVCIGNGNVVSQFDNTYSASTNLTLPTDFEVVKLKYSNYQMGVLANLSDSADGQNQEAYFFVWDGETAEAGQGIPLGSDRGYGLTSYKGSWVILSHTGQLLFFTGGGWEILATLPFYYVDLIFGDSSADLFGDIMRVEGDVIYFNVTGTFNTYGPKYQKVSQNNPGGVLCYDPNIGIYHRYSPSISPVSLISVTQGNVDTGTGIMTKTGGTIPSTGSPIKYVSDKAGQIGGLITPTIYYSIKHSDTTFSLATTKENAEAGIRITLTTTGSLGGNFFLGLEVYDFGATYTRKSGGLALTGKNSSIYDHIIFGAELNDFDSTDSNNHINVTIPDFHNRGYFVTAKILSPQVLDTTQKLFIKYRPLKTDDSIIIKIKDKDIIGLPISTPQIRTSNVNQCVWTGDAAFRTTADLSDAKTAFDAGEELECEVIAGAGAGVLIKITDIAFGSGTYAVTLSETVEGATSGRFCDVLIDNYRVIGEATSSDTLNYKEFGIGINSTWSKFKVELRGVETTLEELQIVNTVNQPSQ